MKKGFLLMMLLLLGLSSHAQVLTQTIKGRVLDQQSKSPIIGATITIVGSQPLKGTNTDADGYFRLSNVPLGRLSISCRALGYLYQDIPNLLLTSGKETNLEILLQEQVMMMNEVVVKGTIARNVIDKELATVSAKTFDIEQTQRFAGSRNDPARMASSFAGVVGNNDSRNDIIIRGNSPTGLLWRLEGIDIPNPNHFGSLGATGGPVGMLNNNQLGRSAFLTGAFPSMYGNAVSGVFDLQLRNGNQDKREYTGQMGFNGFELGAEGPFSQNSKASYLINYRYSVLDFFKKLGINFGTGTGVPRYQDLSFKINIPTTKAGTFVLFGMGGKSNISFRDEQEANFYSKGQNLDYTTSAGSIGLSNTYFFNKGTSSKVSIALSGADVRTVSDKVEKGVTNPEYRETSKQSRLSVSYTFNHKINAKHLLTAGTTYNLIMMNYLDSAVDGTKFKTLRNFMGNTILWQGYSNWQYRPNNLWTINAGLYYQHLTLNKNNSLEPRLGIAYSVSPRQRLSLGLGKHSQLQPLMLYFARNNGIEINRSLDFSKANHFVLGYEYSLTSKSRLKIETYYQDLYNIPVEQKPSNFSMLNFGADFFNPSKTNLSNTGTGRNYGVEITLERNFSEGYYYLLTTSVYDSKYKGSDGKEYNTAFNGNYIANVLAGKEFKLGKNQSLSFDTKITVAGGRRFTPIDVEASKKAGEEVSVGNSAFSESANAYFRADLKITFRQNKKKIMQEWFVDLQNITNRQNLFSRYYDNASQTIKQTYQLGLYPVINYRIQF
jgi:CarboxypepD_reg-like domain